MKEIALQKQIVEYLNYNKCFVWRNNAGMFFKEYKGKTHCLRAGVKGLSDITGMTAYGVFIAIECKIKYNKPTKAQNDFLQEVGSRGGIAFVAYSLDDVIKNIKNYL